MVKSITKNAADPREDQSTPSRIQEGGVENPRKKYLGHSEQLSEEGNTGHSGLLHLADGSPRYRLSSFFPTGNPIKGWQDSRSKPEKVNGTKVVVPSCCLFCVV